MSESFLIWLEDKPKAELHVHLEGSLFPKTLNKIAQRKGLTPYSENPYEFKNFTEFNNCFAVLGDVLTQEEDFFDLAYDFCGHQAANNIVYTEAFFMPYFHAYRGCDLKSALKGLEAGFRKGEAKYSLTIKILYNTPRLFGAKAGWETLKVIEKFPWERVIGIDLAGMEQIGDVAVMAPVFAQARKMGLFTVAHAGELTNWQQIAKTLDLLKPRRIGHGVKALDNEELIKRLVDEDICLEMALTSNLLLNVVRDIKEHPIKPLFDKGIKVALNTDDPAFFRTSLNREFGLLIDELSFSKKDLQEILENGFKYAFAYEGVGAK